jgi:predicted nucleic acid-binding protein
LSHHAAVELVQSWLRFPVQEMSVPILYGALEIKAAHRLSYWDAAIVAAAHALGCHEVLTEDMSHGREIDGVVIIDPFR